MYIYIYIYIYICIYTYIRHLYKTIKYMYIYYSQKLVKKYKPIIFDVSTSAFFEKYLFYNLHCNFYILCVK